MEQKTEKKRNAFARALRFIFIHNWGLKLAAIVTAAALWFVTAGFTPLV